MSCCEADGCAFVPALLLAVCIFDGRLLFLVLSRATVIFHLLGVPSQNIAGNILRIVFRPIDTVKKQSSEKIQVENDTAPARGRPHGRQQHII